MIHGGSYWLILHHGRSITPWEWCRWGLHLIASSTLLRAIQQPDWKSSLIPVQLPAWIQQEVDASLLILLISTVPYASRLVGVKNIGVTKESSNSMFAPACRTAYHMLVAPCLDCRFTSCSVLATNLSLGVVKQGARWVNTAVVFCASWIVVLQMTSPDMGNRHGETSIGP